MEVEEEKAVNPGSGVKEWWWWAAASAAQLGWGIASYRRGYAGNSNLMPFKAFAVASLFVGSGASAAISSLRANGGRPQRSRCKYKDWPWDSTKKHRMSGIHASLLESF